MMQVIDSWPFSFLTVKRDPGCFTVWSLLSQKQAYLWEKEVIDHLTMTCIANVCLTFKHLHQSQWPQWLPQLSNLTCNSTRLKKQGPVTRGKSHWLEISLTCDAQGTHFVMMFFVPQWRITRTFPERSIIIDWLKETFYKSAPRSS